MIPTIRGDYFGGSVWEHRNRIGGRVRGWPHGLTVYLCGQQSSVHPCGSPPFPPVDGVVPTTVTCEPKIVPTYVLSTKKMIEDLSVCGCLRC